MNTNDLLSPEQLAEIRERFEKVQPPFWNAQSEAFHTKRFQQHLNEDFAALLAHAAALQAQLDALNQDRCGGCGGPHLFDTSVPSPLWNRIIRQQGLSDYLCTSCIVKAFVRARTSFTAELYGPEVNGDRVPRISVQIDDIPIDDSYGDLQARLREMEATTNATTGAQTCVRCSNSLDRYCALCQNSDTCCCCKLATAD